MLDKALGYCHGTPEDAFIFAFLFLLLYAFLPVMNFMLSSHSRALPVAMSLSASFVTWSHLTRC
jgi:hypothetical protein